MASANRRFGPPPVAFLGEKAAGMDPATRAALYEVLALDGGPEALDWLTGAVVRDQDSDAVRRGAVALRRRLLEAPR